MHNRYSLTAIWEPHKKSDQYKTGLIGDLTVQLFDARLGESDLQEVFGRSNQIMGCVGRIILGRETNVGSIDESHINFDLRGKGIGSALYRAFAGFCVEYADATALVGHSLSKDAKAVRRRLFDDRNTGEFMLTPRREMTMIPFSAHSITPLRYPYTKTEFGDTDMSGWLDEVNVITLGSAAHAQHFAVPR